MSNITPVPQATVIKAYKNVGWDNTYQDVRWFTTEAQRQAYLSPKLIGQWTQCSIVSPGRSFKVTGHLNDVLVGNYVSFTNNGIGTPERTFYAFIISVNYVNVNTVEIQYEIDWIQTFLFEFNIESCLVEREHVNDDTVGANTLPEQLDTGEYVVRYQQTSSCGPAVFVYLLTNTTTCKNQGNVVTCCEGRGYLLNALDSLAELLDALNTTPERVALITMGTAEMIGSDGYLQEFQDTKDFNRFNDFVLGDDSYTPKNNKLYTYPYNFLVGDNYNGQVETYHWEDFSNPAKATFVRAGGPVPKPCIEFYPQNYKNTTTPPNASQNFSITYDNFPECPFPTDTFKAWVSQYGAIRAISDVANVTTTAIGMAGGVISSAATMNPVGVINSVAGGLNSMAQTGLSTAQEVVNHKIHSLQMNGSIGQSAINFAMNRIGFRLMHMTIRPEYARRIDQMFTRYGYRVDCTKVPNITGRQYVNYVKAVNSHVSGNISTDAKLALETALNNGVSFWHTDNIGAHLTSNPIV